MKEKEEDERGDDKEGYPGGKEVKQEELARKGAGAKEPKASWLYRGVRGWVGGMG